jgi:hypothetical protein
MKLKTKLGSLSTELNALAILMKKNSINAMKANMKMKDINHGKIFSL